MLLPSLLGAQEPLLPAVPGAERPSAVLEPQDVIPLRPYVDLTGDKPEKRTPVSFRGERVSETPGLWSIENGAMEQDGLLLLADKITYDPNTRELVAQGRIRVEGPGLRLRCERLEMNWETRNGEAWLLELEIPPTWSLRASKVRFTELKQWAFGEVELSPCPQEKPGWTAKLARLDLDLDQWATFTHARIKVGPVPVLYLPWAIYPAKAQRSSGLLPPMPGLSGHLGASLALAYYQVLGEGADATLAPEYFSKQGILWGGELRWALDPSHQGTFHGQYIHQRVDGDNRYRWSLKELWQREDGWRLAADLTQASDALLEADYGRGVGQLGTASYDSSVYLGKNYPWASVSVNAAEQRTFFNPQDPFYSTDFPASLRRMTLPSIQGRMYPVSIGNFYLDAETRGDRFGYRMQLGDGLGGGDYFWTRGDLATRIRGRLGQWGPFSTDVQLGARFTRYSASIGKSVFDPSSGADGEQIAPAMDAFRVDGPALNRILGSGRIQWTAPQVGRLFKDFRLLGYAGELKHIVEPYAAYTENSRNGAVGRTPRFDDIDTVPGVSRSAVGERSLELGLKQHLLGRPDKSTFFNDLVRWRVSVKYYFNPILLADGRFKKGWGSLDNEIDAEPDRRLRISFRRSSEFGQGGSDVSLSTDFLASEGTSFRLAYFSTGLNRFLVRQKGLQFGGSKHFLEDRLRLEFSANYDFHQKTFSSSQAALAYVTPCLATTLRYTHQVALIPSSFTREDRIDVTFTLRGLGGLFTWRQ